MSEQFSKLIKILNEKKFTISTMESCTGGMLASEITNISGSSNVFKLGYVTYADETKAFVGVNKKLIDEYTVYSTQVAIDMAKTCLKNANSTYGVGITGKLDKEDDKIYIGIYDSINKKDYIYEVKAGKGERINKKFNVVNFVVNAVLEIL